ncbi:photosynthetic protein synthase II [Neptunitalea chrysea]|uniref:Photosynthetic protein synthase II n=1 Tax=Neptunitalea chrysea TaxID=1647581 RepID=A0A9W6ET32_9FLAO|nr:SCO family protein [Neptunitalea chrysea]GLB51020.1 photosynthetic protein synthase II [Neptunitalea chrysea]
MKNKNYVIGLTAVIVIFGIFTIRMVSKKIGNNSVVDDDRHRVAAEEYVEMKRMGKVPNFSFTDQNGKTITNEDYKGKVYVIEFFFTTCPSICPIMNRNMVRVQDEFVTKDNFGIASFTIDPEHDTPEVLLEYAKKHKVTNPDWHFLTGDRNEIYTLANKGLMIYAGEGSAANGGFEHSGQFLIVDKEGYVICRVVNGNPVYGYDGTNNKEVENLITDIGIELRK